MAQVPHSRLEVLSPYFSRVIYPKFFLGIEYELQIDINLAEAQQQLAILDRELRSADARAHLTMLRHIFGAYGQQQIRDFELVAATPKQRVEAFLTFVEQAEYKALSKERRLFGFPALLRKAQMKFDHLVDLISGTGTHRQLITLATKQIELATKIAMPDAKMLEGLQLQAYLPPIISLDQYVARAKAAWKRAKPPLIPLPKRPDDKWMQEDDDDWEP